MQNILSLCMGIKELVMIMRVHYTKNCGWDGNFFNCYMKNSG